jgi:hypothetical protein
MLAYTPKNILLKPQTPIVIGASVSNQVVSEEAAVTAGGSVRLRVTLVCSDVTSTTGITAKLQMRIAGDWEDLAGANASVTIDEDGEFSITQLIERSADQPNLPLKSKIRVLATTGADDAVTIDAIYLLQPT